jgi:hypothetical protein
MAVGRQGIQSILLFSFTLVGQDAASKTATPYALTLAAMANLGAGSRITFRLRRIQIKRNLG